MINSILTLHYTEKILHWQEHIICLIIIKKSKFVLNVKHDEHIFKNILNLILRYII